MSNKLQRTAEILDEIAEAREKVLVFTEYINMIDLFVEFLSKRYEINIYQIDGRTPIENRQNEIDRFSAEKGFSIMILNPRTAGMGLNITAANHVIHYTRQWNPALEEQASARAYRNKQENPVNIYYLYYVDSIEEYMDNRLRLKKQLSSEVVSEQDFQLSDAEMIESVNVTPKKQ
jgi:SNF2 family DNA or RNA helicase